MGLSAELYDQFGSGILTGDPDQDRDKQKRKKLLAVLVNLSVMLGFWG